MRVSGSGFGVSGLGFRVSGFGFRGWGLGSDKEEENTKFEVEADHDSQGAVEVGALNSKP